MTFGPSNILIEKTDPNDQKNNTIRLKIKIILIILKKQNKM